MTFIPEEDKPNRWQKFSIACVLLGVLVLGLGFVVSLLQEATADDQPDKQTTTETSEATADPAASGPAAPGSAMEALDGLRIVTHDIAPYDREADFGGRWTDTDGNGCTTRQDIMARDATEWVDADGDCQPEQVVIADRYTGTAFVATNVGDAHTEHVVSAHDAWLTGAQNLTQAEREAFYQDPVNLITVEGSVNMAKGDKNAAQWLPPFEGGHCEFAAQQVTVKAKYDLGVTDAEYVTLSDILAGCPDQGLVTVDSLADIPDVGEVPALTGGNDVPTEDVNPAPTSDAPSSDDEVHFENCTQAREAGAAPVKKGDPGYGPHLDRDGDGVGCQ